MLAEKALNVVNPEVVAPKPPKQTKLLGATVNGVGVIVCVSQSLKWGYAIIEDVAGKNHHAFLADLKKDQLEFPAEPQLTASAPCGLVTGCGTRFIPYSRPLRWKRGWPHERP
jgi:hypothetical protein